MEINKIIAQTERPFDIESDGLYLIEHKSDKDPYGIYTTTEWNSSQHTRYVIVYRGYYIDYSNHGSNYEIAFDDFTTAWDEFKNRLKAYRFETVELCEGFKKAYSCLYEEDDYSSSTNGDYSPSCPWKAPGMTAHDFI